MRTKAVEILLVEDNLGDAQLIQTTLQDVAAGAFALTRVPRLAEALQCLNDVTFDLILLDLGLPDCTGFDTLTKLMPRAANVPILVLTGVDDEELGEAAIANGAQDYLIKGQLLGHRLWRVIRYAIERHRLLMKYKSAEQMRVMCEMAGAAAHEINQPLTAVIGYAELALDMVGPDHEVCPELTKIRDAGQTIKNIIQQMNNIKQYATKPYLEGIRIVDFEQAAKKSMLGDVGT